MTEDLDLCPVCKEGLLEPKKISVTGAEGQFRETSSTREFVCDKCGHKLLREYVDVSDSVSAEKQGPNKKRKK